MFPLPAFIAHWYFSFAQVVASCQQQPFPDPTEDDGGELPRFQDVYKMLQDVMEDKVPAALGACEQYVVCRLLDTLAVIVTVLGDNLNEEREVLSNQVAWAAVQPVMGSMMDSDTSHLLTYPSMSKRMENLRASWNPLRLSPEIIQKHWHVIDNHLKANVFRSGCPMTPEKSAVPTTTRRGRRQEPRSLEASSASKRWAQRLWVRCDCLCIWDQIFMLACSHFSSFLSTSPCRWTFNPDTETQIHRVSASQATHRYIEMCIFCCPWLFFLCYAM